MSGLIISILIGTVIGLTIYQRKGGQSARRAEQEEPVKQAERTYESARPVTRSAGGFRGGNGSPREIREAIEAGEQALSSLRAAKSKLDSARMWGVADLLGGGMITSMVKHGTIHSANEWMDAANRDLRRFARELQDVSDEGFYVKTGDLLTFLDLFCDNFFSDFLMQNRINEARGRIDQVISRVQNTLWDLKAMENSESTFTRGTAYSAAAGHLPTLGSGDGSSEEDYTSSQRRYYQD